MLNIIIRTSNRPFGFRDAVRSINGISANTHLIVGYDNAHALSYIIPSIEYYSKATLVDVTPMRVRYATEKCFYNLYLNELVLHAKPGHILFLDDDDTFLPDALVNLPTLETGVSYVVPFMRGEVQKPTPAMMHAKKISPGYIGLPCLILATTHVGLTTFDGSELADYRAIEILSRATALRWLNKPLVSSPKRNYGKTP